MLIVTTILQTTAKLAAGLVRGLGGKVKVIEPGCPYCGKEVDPDASFVKVPLLGTERLWHLPCWSASRTIATHTLDARDPGYRLPAERVQ